MSYKEGYLFIVLTNSSSQFNTAVKSILYHILLVLWHFNWLYWMSGPDILNYTYHFADCHPYAATGLQFFHNLSTITCRKMYEIIQVQCVDKPRICFGKTSNIICFRKCARYCLRSSSHVKVRTFTEPYNVWQNSGFSPFPKLRP